jgi:hypothetical protein
MSLATLAGAATPALSDLVDGLALRTGAWVVVERFGLVLTHGPGTADCPEPVMRALLAKSTGPLRDRVVWSRSGRRLAGGLAGTVDGQSLAAVDLGAGATAWFVGGPVEVGSLPLLAAAVQVEAPAVTDPVVEELLHPRGPARRGRAPQALLVVLRAEDRLPVLSRRAAAVVAGTDARVHTDGELVVVALAPAADAEALVDAVAAGCPTVVAGVAAVAEEASDWTTAARQAAGAASAAADLGLRTGRADDPLVAAELVVQEAQEAVAGLVRELPDSPLRRLQAHDARGGSDLVASLTAWCRAGFDVPAAATALHVHTNTLRYRLRRAAEVSGLDLTRPRQLLALQLLLAV